MPIIGKNTIGGSSGSVVRYWSCKFTAPEAGTFTDLNFYGSSTGNASYRLCIWADNAGVPGALLFRSDAASINTTDQVWTRPCSYSFSNGQVMHLGFVSDDWSNVYSDAGSANQFTEFSEDYTAWDTTPNPPGILGQSAVAATIYGNYTASAPPDDTAKGFFGFF